MALPERMKFGIFMGPFHRVGENPTLAIDRDLELVQWLDHLGFDEAWIGEHYTLPREPCLRSLEEMQILREIIGT